MYNDVEVESISDIDEEFLDFLNDDLGSINYSPESEYLIDQAFNREPDTDSNIEISQKNFAKNIIDDEPPRNVYVINCVSTNFYKIGISNDVDKRMSTLQTGCPFELRLVALIKAEFNDTLGYEIRAIEKFYHKNYEDLNVRGEWFELNASMISDLVYFSDIKRDLEFDIFDPLVQYFYNRRIEAIRWYQEDVLGLS
ncbi:GIY-YIG nuclease family protein [Vibrio parahaemolyticus]|uniref:GIY-YIG nuclease family protein n=1 Tax=Vibrio parahaemolyticus TaxID=670 RepID=UPI0016558749|nr:GIY-YIG nuclease family protein [Vibrio parahaemolyticus]MBC8664011.1 GIY-YIG nuclease family protein [Vibrio parahaemolyticus]